MFTASVLQEPFVHFAASGAEVSTSAQASYPAPGRSIRSDTHHCDSHHSPRQPLFAAEDGPNTNHVEAKHRALKRDMRRQFWQFASGRRRFQQCQVASSGVQVHLLSQLGTPSSVRSSFRESVLFIHMGGE